MCFGDCTLKRPGERRAGPFFMFSVGCCNANIAESNTAGSILKPTFLQWPVLRWDTGSYFLIPTVCCIVEPRPAIDWTSSKNEKEWQGITSCELGTCEVAIGHKWQKLQPHTYADTLSYIVSRKVTIWTVGAEHEETHDKMLRDEIAKRGGCRETFISWKLCFHAFLISVPINCSPEFYEG